MLEDVRAGPEDAHHALGDRSVQFVVRPEVDSGRHLPPSHADGHAASDSHLPSLVAARHDDPGTRSALRVSPDDHGLAIQVRILPPLDAHVERVHIHVEHDAGHVDLSPVVVKTYRGAGAHWTQNSLSSGSNITTQFSPGSSHTRCFAAPSPASRSTSLLTRFIRSDSGTLLPPEMLMSR